MRFLSMGLGTLLLVMTVLFSLSSPVLAADPATVSAYLNQFKSNAGSRVETLSILGGEDGASGGLYSYENNKNELNVSKAGGRGTIGDPSRIGDTDMYWLPFLGGSIGYSEAQNRFNNTPILLNNTELYTSFAMGFEAGVRILLTKEISIGPMMGVIYSHANSKFTPGTELGLKLKQNFAKQLVDWNMDTISAVPSIDIQYEKIFDKDWRLTLSSRYDWFKTWDVASSSKYLSLSGNSSYWENKVDLDIRLPLKVLGFPLHTGGFVSAGILGGDIRDTINTNAMYTFNGRLVVGDLTGLWKVNWLGIGVSYIKSETFHGLSYGIDARLLF